jgi:hypothetical protein
MAHLYNRNAFASGFTLSSPLVSTYCQLCCIEMMLIQYLKKNGTPTQGTHNIPVLLTTLALQPEIAPSDVGTINGFSGGLATKLSSLRRQGVSSIGPVRPSSYPDIRYVRHNSDFLNNCSTTADIAALQSYVQQIYSTLLSITQEPV